MKWILITISIQNYFDRIRFIKIIQNAVVYKYTTKTKEQNITKNKSVVQFLLSTAEFVLMEKRAQETDTAPDGSEASFVVVDPRLSAGRGVQFSAGAALVG